MISNAFKKSLINNLYKKQFSDAFKWRIYKSQVAGYKLLFENKRDLETAVKVRIGKSTFDDAEYGNIIYDIFYFRKSFIYSIYQFKSIIDLFDDALKFKHRIENTLDYTEYLEEVYD